MIEVRDTGPGIPAAHRDRIFDRFYRVDPGRSREEGGVGLGLAIARWAVEANGGQIELASEGTDGSLFRVILPAPDDSSAAGGDRQHQERPERDTCLERWPLVQFFRRFVRVLIHRS